MRSIAERGHRVDVAADFASPAEILAVESLGATVHHVPTERHGMNPVHEFDYARRLRRILRTVKPDAVLAYTAKPVSWGIPEARAAGVEQVVALVTGLGFAFIDGGGWRRSLARSSLSFLYRRAFACCSAVVFQNPDDRAEMLRRRILPAEVPAIVVGGSGVDLDAFPEVVVPGVPSFLMISRLLGDKGVREYATAGATLARRYGSVAFRLAGWVEDGPDAVSPTEVADRASGGVEFLGRLEDVRPEIARCTCYVLPSYREGTPRTVLEAMSTGRAIVTADVPGCRQTVDEGVNGLLVPPRDPGALAEAMERFIVEPGMAVRMGAASRRLAELRFDVREVNRRLLQCLGIEP